jgi:hypothetical protein
MLGSLFEIGCSVRKAEYSMEYAYFVAIGTVCVVTALLVLVRQIVQKVRPCSFRLSVGIARILFFKVEMDSHRHDVREVVPDLNRRR